MRVSIIKDKKIQNTILPNNIVGNFWISDIDHNGIKRNLISIEADNGRWKLISNSEVYCINNDGVVIPYVFLGSNCFYYIVNNVEKGKYLIYCSDLITKYNIYNINSLLDKGISIDGSDQAFIKYNFLGEKNCIIIRVNGKIYIYDNGCKYGVYVNNVRVSAKKELHVGDVIFIVGLKLVYNIFTNIKGERYSVLFVNNKNNSSIIVNGEMEPIQDAINADFEEAEEEIEYPLYDEQEYFHKKPRIKYELKPLVLQVDAPPSKPEDNNASLLMTIGPMLTMSMTSLVMGYTAINNVLDGNSTWKNAIPSLVICGAMFATMFLWPIINKKFAKKQKIANEKERQKKYKEYIDEKKDAIKVAKKEQKTILINNYPNIKDVESTIINKYTTLWQRRIEDDDFLTVSLGIGNCPMKIDIKYPEDHFSMVEDNLKDIVSELGKEPKELSGVPITFSFIENYISALVGKEQLTGEYTRRLLLQILAFHSYDDLKIVFLTDDEKAYQWTCFKSLPHLFTNDKSLRFFATNNDEYKEVCYYLERVYNSRKGSADLNNSKKYFYDEEFLIITDSFKSIRNYNIINSILNDKKNYGFSLFILDEKLTNLTEQCSQFIQINKDNGSITSVFDNGKTTEFIHDLITDIDYEKCISTLSNIPIEIISQKDGQLPNKIGFLEMYDVGKIEQLNSLERWHKSNPILNLSVPIGVGKNGEKINVDLHEKYHGPHGLIAGMTGSGKSELIITYILSMAINYHPDEVQFVLIDYKGGGLAGAFENPVTGLKLPHLVGTITNLDANEINRSLSSINSELKRRQALFNKARQLSGESTIDIYKYQQLYRNRVVNEPVSHLFIITDEFAELKNQQPEFMDQLITTARIGRSLGVHLILATQKPSGVVDPQIWSNTRFRICMRVQDTSDSNEVIKCKDAAYLKQTGRFYFQVGYNEVFLLGQAAWAGGKYIPSEKVKNTIDTSIDFIDNIGYNTKIINTKEKALTTGVSSGEEVLNIVKYLDKIAKEQNINCKPLWLKKIPEEIRIEDLARKYDYHKTPFDINVLVGEYDIPQRQEQKLLTIPITANGNVVMFGASGSGKENFISTLIYSSMLFYTPTEVNYYIADFGAESLRMFWDSPIVGDILMLDDQEKLKNLFKMITTTIEYRKDLFADYNGSYQNYCHNSGKTVPNLIVIINNYDAFQETYSDLDEQLISISRDCNKYGIYFVLTLNTSNGMRFKLKQNFPTILTLQQNNEDDYSNILGNVHKIYPSKIFGRGIIKLDNIYEFQIANICERSKIAVHVKNVCSEYATKFSNKACSIPVLPKVVEFANVKEEFGKTNDLIIGVDKNNLEVSKFNFIKNYITFISSLDITLAYGLVNSLINQIVALNKYQLFVINAEDYNINKSNMENIKYYDNNFNYVFSSLNAFINKTYDNYEKNNFDKELYNNYKKIYIIIIGLDSFKMRLNSESKTKFGDMFTKLKELNFINYIIVEQVDKIRKYEFESWYKDCVHNDTGIWLGNGINDQFSLKFSQKINDMKLNVPDGFCFVINKGNPKYVKYLNNIDFK